MAEIRIKGHLINPVKVRDSFYRRAIKYSNNAVSSLRKLGVDEDDIDIEIIRAAMKKEPAKIGWYMNGHNMQYSYGQGSNYAENMFIAAKVIELQINELLEDNITMDDFLRSFSEDEDVEEERKKARATLGILDDEIDMATINKAYKDLAKRHHPDMDSGDVHMFKEINKAHKILKRELM